MPRSDPALDAPPRMRRKPPRSSLRQTIREYLGARELLKNLVRRDLKIQHRGTALGAMWSLITPALQVALYTFIFTVIMPTSPARDSGKAPFAVYLFVGLTIWNLMQNGVIGGTGSIVGSAYILTKVYFPREILPLASVLSALITFLWEIGVALLATIVFVGLPDWHVVYAPVVVLVAALLSFGIGTFLAAATVFFRDVAHFIGIAMQIWFWGTPIIYSISLIQHKPMLLKLIQLNPMAGVVVSFRNVLILNASPDWKLLAYDAGAAILIIVGALLFFRRHQNKFPELI